MYLPKYPRYRLDILRYLLSHGPSSEQDLRLRIRKSTHPGHKLFSEKEFRDILHALKEQGYVDGRDTLSWYITENGTKRVWDN